MPKKRVWKAKLTEGFQPVMIDLDVHKAIEGARRSFTEMPNTILRRLLGLDHHRSLAATGHSLSHARNGGRAGGAYGEVNGRRHAISLPDGAELRAAYCGVTVTGAVHEGAWEVEGSRFSVPATLISSLHDHIEAPASLQGWRQWEVRLPGAEDWMPLAELA